MVRPKTIQFTVFSLATFILFYRSLQELVSFSLSSNLYLYTLFLPLVSLYFLYDKRRMIFSNRDRSVSPPGALLILIGLILYFCGKQWRGELTLNDYLSVMTLSFLITWLGGVVFFYGLKFFRRALFPLCLLLMMVPIPGALLERVVFLLQKSSTETVDWIFTITNVPVHRDGFVFSLSHVDIAITDRCSGIRSTLYLFITGLVFGQAFLKTSTRRVMLALAVFPISIFKNALRIVMLSLLGNYVHVGILSSSLHTRGGIPFMILAVIMLAIVVRTLRSTEKDILAVETRKEAQRSGRKGVAPMIVDKLKPGT